MIWGELVWVDEMAGATRSKLYSIFSPLQVTLFGSRQREAQPLVFQAWPATIALLEALA